MDIYMCVCVKTLSASAALFCSLITFDKRALWRWVLCFLFFLSLSFIIMLHKLQLARYLCPLPWRHQCFSVMVFNGSNCFSGEKCKVEACQSLTVDSEKPTDLLLVLCLCLDVCLFCSFSSSESIHTLFFSTHTEWISSGLGGHIRFDLLFLIYFFIALALSMGNKQVALTNPHNTAPDNQQQMVFMLLPRTRGRGGKTGWVRGTFYLAC